MNKKEYYSIPEYAKRVGLSRISIYKKVKQGQIRSVRMGRTYYIPRKETGLDKSLIDRSLKKGITEYGDALRMLGRE